MDVSNNLILPIDNSLLLLDSNKSSNSSAKESNLELNGLYVEAMESQKKAKEAHEAKKKARELRNKAKKAVKEQKMQKSANRIQPDREIVLPESRQLNSKEILTLLFSQNSIAGKISDGTMTLDQLAENMSNHGWLESEQITLVRMPNNSLVSADNRRLYAAKIAAKINPDFILKANIWDHTDRSKELRKGIVRGFANAQKIKTAAVEALALPEGIEKGTYGQAMILRINTWNQGGNLAESHFGYEEVPAIIN